MTDYPKSDYDEYPKTLPRDDLWGQVRRTINGRRISEEEVTEIVDAIISELALSPIDSLLDLACGNGALTERLFGSCGDVVGVDRSAYLIEVAQEKFQTLPTHVFRESDILAYLRCEPDPRRFTKGMCCGSMQYLSRTYLATMLAELHDRFGAMERMLLGNVPDRDRSELFLRENPNVTELDLDDPAAQVGVWWSQAQLRRAATDAGWAGVEFIRLPDRVFNARYRYDAILTRNRA